VSISISNAAAIAACDAIVDRVDLNSPPGLLRIYSGTPPADADSALSGNTLLSEPVMSNPAFGNAADANPGGRAVANAIADDTDANATGTAAFFRIYNGNGTTCVLQGSVTATGGGGDLTINTVAIQIHALVKVTSLAFTQPET
jgi:hypothetical protein